MESKYEVIETDKSPILKRTDADGTIWWIPLDPANSDYQEYLKSLEA